MMLHSVAVLHVYNKNLHLVDKSNVPCWWHQVCGSHLFVLLQLRVVDLSDLRQLGSVVRVFCRVVHAGSSRSRRRCSRRRRASAFLRTGYAFCQQHVVQPHELGIRRLLLLGAADTQHCNDRKRSEVIHKGHTYSGVMHRNKLSAAEADCWAAHTHTHIQQCDWCSVL